jgi:hypothetical protein
MYTNKQWAQADPNVTAFIAASSGSAAAIEGFVGVGKSTVIINAAKQLNLTPLLVIGSTHPPEDFSGIPYVHADTAGDRRYFEQVPPKFASDSVEKACMIFLDELTTVKPSTRAPMLSWLSERMICGRKVHPDSIFVAAYNPYEIAPDATPLEKSMANRFFHSQWVHDKIAWDKGMIDGEFTPSWIPKPPPRSEWERFREPVGQQIVAYTNNNNGDLCQSPEDDSQYAFPTPRSWTYLRNAIALARSMDAPKAIIRKLCVGFVGDVVGRSFNQYLDTFDLIDVEESIANPMKFKHDNARPDLTVVLMSGVVTSLKREFTTERITNALKLFCDNIGGGKCADLALGQLRHLTETKPTEPEPYRWNKEQTNIIKAFGDRLPAEFRKKMAARRGGKS